MVGKQNTWQNIQQFIWLGLGVVCLFVALVFWAKLDKDSFTEIKKTAETEIDLQIQPEKVASMTQLGALTEVVKPLDMSVRVAITAQHEAEFRGTKFIQENARNTAIELFRVGDEDIIKSFLRKQLNRKPYTYIRLSGENQLEQYVMLYGNYNNQMDAEKALASLNVGLAKSLKPQLQSLESYKAYVNDIGSDELVSQKIFAVQLKTVPVPIIDETALLQRRAAAAAAEAAVRQNRESAPQIPTTTTTVTRRDAEGNVVDVEKSQSTESNSPKAVQEIHDPFN